MFISYFSAGWIRHFITNVLRKRTIFAKWLLPFPRIKNRRWKSVIRKTFMTFPIQYLYGDFPENIPKMDRF